MAQVYVTDCCGTAYTTAIAAEYHLRADSCGGAAAAAGGDANTTGSKWLNTSAGSRVACPSVTSAALDIVSRRCGIDVPTGVRRR